MLKCLNYHTSTNNSVTYGKILMSLIFKEKSKGKKAQYIYYLCNFKQIKNVFKRIEYFDY